MPPAVIIGGAILAGAATKAITGRKAAKAQVKAGARAIVSQEKALEKTIDISEPFRRPGIGALDLLNQIFVQGDTGKILEAPGISFLREEGEKALGRIQSARGNFLSGAAVKEGIRFAERLASTNLAQVAVEAARDLVASEYGNEYLPDSPREFKSKVKNAQEAHEAIRPAGHPFELPSMMESELTSDEFKLFLLIW